MNQDSGWFGLPSLPAIPKLPSQEQINQTVTNTLQAAQNTLKWSGWNLLGAVVLVLGIWLIVED